MPEIRKVEEFEVWVVNPGNTRARLALFHRALDLYWSIKVLLRKTMAERGEAYAYILSQLDRMQKELTPLKDVPYNLKMIEAKQGLLADFVGAK